MSLLTDAYESCTILDKRTMPDGYGGTKTQWVDGAPIMAAASGVTGLYTVTTSKVLNLQYHDVFRRERDGKIFRVTSDGDDEKTPNTGTLDMRQVSAEEWKL